MSDSEFMEQMERDLDQVNRIIARIRKYQRVMRCCDLAIGVAFGYLLAQVVSIWSI